MTNRTGAEGLADTISAMALKRDAEKKLWTEPTEEMVNAGIAELQRSLEEWQNSDTAHYSVEELTDSQASDIVVFILQAMASKLPRD